MWWNEKVVWSEGMLVRPQHFQQQDRYLQNLIQQRVAPVRPYPWGLLELELNDELLDQGRIGIVSCSGVFDDGTPFKINPKEVPGEESSVVITVPREIDNAIVCLAVPLLRTDAVEVAREEPAGSAVRFVPREPMNILNTNADDRIGDNINPTAPIQTAKMRFRLLIKEERGRSSASEQTSDTISSHSYLGVARIQRRTGDKIELDRSYIPPCLDSRASPILVGYIEWLNESLESLADGLIKKIGEAVRGGVSELHNFLLLQIVNRCLPLVRHWRMREPGPHPLELYERSLELAGELATLVNSTRQVPDFPVYRHDDLKTTFQDVEKFIRDALGTGPIRLAKDMKIKPDKYGYYVADIKDKALLGRATFMIAVKARMPKDKLDAKFPRSVTIAAPQEIHEIQRKKITRGVEATPAQQCPPQIPLFADTSYFLLEQHSVYWERIVQSGGLALHLEGDFPSIEMILWAIEG